MAVQTNFLSLLAALHPFLLAIVLPLLLQYVCSGLVSQTQWRKCKGLNDAALWGWYEAKEWRTPSSARRIFVICPFKKILLEGDQYWKDILEGDQYWKEILEGDQYWKDILEGEQYWKNILEGDQ